jgi:hypothetical protein
MKSVGDPCGICGDPIDYSLPHLHPESFVIDEIVPIAKGGRADDPSNVQPAHRICNRLKSDSLDFHLRGLADAYARSAARGCGGEEAKKQNGKEKKEIKSSRRWL